MVGASSFGRQSVGHPAHHKELELLDKPSAIIAELTSEVLAAASYATLSGRAVTEEASGLVDHLLGVLNEHETSTGTKKYQRVKTAAVWRAALEGFLTDLLDAAGNAKCERWTYRSLDKESFTGEGASARHFRRLYQALVVFKLIEHVKGRKRWTANAFDSSGAPYATGGHASHFRATTALLDLANSFGITPENAFDHFQEPVPDEVIILKTGNSGSWQAKTKGLPMRFEMTRQVAELDSEVRALNIFLSTIEIKGGKHSGYQRIFNEGDLVVPYRWEKGGRLYSSGNSYQTKSPEARGRMTFNGESVAEVDAKASYLTILSGLAGCPYDASDDPYDIGLDRSVVKTWTVVTLGSKKHIARWPADKNAAYREATGRRMSDVASVHEVRKRMVAKHPALAIWGEQTHGEHTSNLLITWADLMFAESNAIIGAMTDLMRMGKPSLCVHDSILVRVSDVADAKVALARNYQIACGVIPQFNVSPAATAQPAC